MSESIVKRITEEAKKQTDFNRESIRALQHLRDTEENEGRQETFESVKIKEAEPLSQKVKEKFKEISKKVELHDVNIIQEVQGSLHRLILESNEGHPAAFSEWTDHDKFARVHDPVSGFTYVGTSDYFKDIFPSVFLVSEVKSEKRRIG